MGLSLGSTLGLLLCASHLLLEVGVMTPKPRAAALGCTSPGFLQAPQIQHIPNLTCHLTPPGCRTCFPGVLWVEGIAASLHQPSYRLSSFRGSLPANLPHIQSVTMSYRFYLLKLLKTVPNSLSLTVTSAPGLILIFSLVAPPPQPSAHPH